MTSFISRPLAAATLMLAACFAQAQPYPSKSVRVIVPNAAGGPSDLVGRVVGQKLAELWGQAVVVENRVGAGGNIGVDAVAKATPDGYTLLITNSAPIVVNQSLYSNIPYDSSRDLAAVSLLTHAPMVLAVPANSPANSVADLIRIAKADPGKLTIASVGNGTAPHLAGELFQQQAGVKFLHVPYRSVPQIFAALMVGEASIFFDVPTIFAQVKAGRMKALAVTSKQRSDIAPDVPTLVESGLPDYEMVAWYGLLTPAGISAELRAKLNADTVRVLGAAEVKAKMKGINFDIVGSTPEAFSAMIKSESARWATVIKNAGVSKVN